MRLPLAQLQPVPGIPPLLRYRCVPEKWIRDTFGQAEDEGGRFVRDEVHLLLRRAPHLLPLMVIRDGLKFLGYRLGIAEDYMPRWLKRRFLSMNPHFFNGG